MTHLTGQCLCGQTKLIGTDAPKFGLRCFCRDCQHVSGGGSAPQVAFHTDHLTLAGPTKTYSQKADSGNDLFFVFCSACGSPLTKATSRMADTVFVYAAVLDDPGAVPELRSVFEESQPDWDK